MVHLSKFSIAVLFLSTAVLGACGGNAPSAGAAASANTKNSVPDADGNVPFEVLRRSVMAANGSDFAGAEKYVLPNSPMGTTITGRNVMPEKWPSLTHNGTISKIEFVSEEYDRFHVYVGYRLHYADGSTFQEIANLMKDDNRWKISFMTRDTPF